jgi:hypothetical protein
LVAANIIMHFSVRDLRPTWDMNMRPLYQPKITQTGAVA